LEFRKNENEKLKEDISVNVKENYVMYHLNDEDREVSVIEDFNRVSAQWIVQFSSVQFSSVTEFMFHAVL